MNTAARRVRFGSMTAVLVGAATVSLVIVNLLGARYSRAWDVTATQEQALSPRTRQLLAQLPAPYEIVVAADSRTIERGARVQVGDVLAQLERESPHVRVTAIDTATAAGASEYAALLERLRERESPRIEAQKEQLRSALADTERLAAAFDALSLRLQSVRSAIPDGEGSLAKNRAYFAQRATDTTRSALGLRDRAAKAAAALEPIAGPPGSPPLDEAAAPLRQTLMDLEPALPKVAGELRLFSEAEEMPAAARDAARPLADAVAALRDQAALLIEELRLELLDIARVSKVLETTQAAIVIGPPEAGLTAIPFDWLFPAGGGANADLRRKGEELFAIAIESLARPVNPIVIVVHGQPVRGFTASPEYQRLVERLGLRGIDVLEWAAVLEPAPPPTTPLESKGPRPAVFLVLNTDSTTGTEQHPGPARAEALGRAIRGIVDQGHPLLLSIAPSELPTYGQKDPTTAVLPHFGLESDSARPLMRSVISPEGTGIDVSWSGTALAGAHPILGAVRNLRARFEWITPLRPVAGASPSVTRLYEIEGRDFWAESQWGELWRLLRAGQVPPTLPSNDSARDDANGPWLIAAAATRTDPATGNSQRLVAVGSNRWFEDSVTAAMDQAVDGRAAQAFPANAELLESSVYWLAGQDERVAQSPAARAVAVIGPLGPGTRSALRWLVLAGIPGLTLLAGLLWRAARG